MYGLVRQGTVQSPQTSLLGSSFPMLLLIFLSTFAMSFGLWLPLGPSGGTITLTHSLKYVHQGIVTSSPKLLGHR